MLATLLAKLREWNILIGFCFVLGGVIFIAWILSMPPESATVALTSAGSQPPASQVASKDAAPATPQSSPAVRAPAELGEAKPTPGGVGAGGTPDARPRLSSTIERPRHLRQSGERSAGTAPCSLGVVRASGTPDAWPTTSATIERPRRRCGERPSGATRYSNTPDTGQRDGCRRRCGDWPPSLQKMPSLPLAGGRQEHAWPEPCRHHRQEIG